jgi:Putative bacterial sensory transduction regulator
VIDVPTMQTWLHKLGFEATPHERPKTLQIRPPPEAGDQPALPPFFIQCTEHWVLLSMLPMLGAGERRPEDLYRRLITANRDMRVAKFAIDKNGDIVLCAELPTESLDFSELADAVARLTQYARLFAIELMQR